MLKRISQIIFASLLLTAAVTAQAPSKAADSKAYADDIAKITAGGNSAERGKAIQESLKKSGIDFTTENFSARARGGREVNGTNVIATIPSATAKRTIMIGAHVDRVGVGTGAIDNASGSAAVLELLRAFKARPLKNVTLMAGFWDQEEVGLIGSRAFVESRAKG